MKSLFSHQYFFLLVVFFSFFFLTEKIFAQSADTINATVQIGICGNDTIEHGEDCEKTNLNGKNCTTLGYNSGELTCDISCSFDVSTCNNNNDTTPTISSSEPTPEPSLLQSVTQSFFENILPQTQTILPSSLQTFDVNNNGKLDLSETFSIISVWKQAWQTTDKKQCDVNGDTTCTLQDLSTLLYYINR